MALWLISDTFWNRAQWAPVFSRGIYQSPIIIKSSLIKSAGTPLFLAFKLYVEHCGEIALRTHVEGETFDVPAAANIPDLEDVPYLDASASLSLARNCLCLAVVNRHQEQAIPQA